MKIVIVGAGYSGLSLAYYLLQENEKIKITLFDPEPLGNNASGVSTGLMHPYLGTWAKRSWRAEEGIQETLKLLAVSENEMEENVYAQKGVFRPALDDRQKKTFRTLCENYEDAEWWGEEKVQEHFSSFLAPSLSGMYVSSGICVNSMKYLQGLWLFLEKRGVSWVQRSIGNLQELEDFDQIIVSAGEKSFLFFPEWEKEVQKRKGHMLVGNWPFSEKLFCPIVGKGHLSYFEEEGSCIMGATYEREFVNKEIDPDRAQEVLQKIATFFPRVSEITIQNIRADIRLSRVDSYLPYLKRVNEKTAIFTAFGSRGLLYHALFAKLVAESLVREEVLVIS